MAYAHHIIHYFQLTAEEHEELPKHSYSRFTFEDLKKTLAQIGVEKDSIYNAYLITRNNGTRLYAAHPADAIFFLAHYDSDWLDYKRTQLEEGLNTAYW